MRQRGFWCRTALITFLLFASSADSFAQSVLSGRLLVDRYAGAEEKMPLSTVLCFASLDGPGREAKSWRTWETEPAGWWRIDGASGNYTLLFTQPAHFFRPIVLNNIFVRAGEKIDRFNLSPRFDFGCFSEKEWDSPAATDYFQPFTAKGRSVTSVGFRLAHDGVDGFGPKNQNLLVSLHRRRHSNSNSNSNSNSDSNTTPDQWPQVGPTIPVLGVDSGGAKNYIWSAGWNSGEVPLVPGETYAVHLRAETPGGVFQPFWSTNHAPGEACYRLSATNAGWNPHCLWMAIATDNDGLLIPYNKRVQKEFGKFGGSAHSWSQTYVAQGQGLASALMYAAVSGAQPPLSRQRALVRVRRGGPRGPVVGVEKVAVGNGLYTGDASWGRFGVAFAPGEVPLEPGKTYAIEFESLENYETLHGFVNIKGQVSDDRAAFNPYRKHERDSYKNGTSYKHGTDAMDFDLDMQIIEYAVAATNSGPSLDTRNLLRNGGFQIGEAAADGVIGTRVDAWKTFILDEGTTHAVVFDAVAKTNRFARVTGGGATGRIADGGWVQRVTGLDRFDTYRVRGRVRASWTLDSQHECLIGIDPTGQEEDPRAATITWTPQVTLHGVWNEFLSEPARPSTNSNSISVWLRGRTTSTGDRFAPFKADFDDFSLHRVQTLPLPAVPGMPGGLPKKTNRDER